MMAGDDRVCGAAAALLAAYADGWIAVSRRNLERDAAEETDLGIRVTRSLFGAVRGTNRYDVALGIVSRFRRGLADGTFCVTAEDAVPHVVGAINLVSAGE